MSWTQEDQDRLLALYALVGSGVRTVTYRDKSVTYHGLDEILKAIGVLEQLKAGEAGVGGRRTLAAFPRDY